MTSFYVYHTLISFSPHYLLLNPGICGLCQHSPTVLHSLSPQQPTLKAWASSFLLFLYPQHKTPKPIYNIICMPFHFIQVFYDRYIFTKTHIWHLYILIWLWNILYHNTSIKISLGSLSSSTLLSSQLICLKSLYLWVNSSRVNICK